MSAKNLIRCSKESQEKTHFTSILYLYFWQFSNLIQTLDYRIRSWRSVINDDARVPSFFPVSPAIFFKDDKSCCACHTKPAPCNEILPIDKTITSRTETIMISDIHISLFKVRKMNRERKYSHDNRLNNIIAHQQSPLAMSTTTSQQFSSYTVSLSLDV